MKNIKFKSLFVTFIIFHSLFIMPLGNTQTSLSGLTINPIGNGKAHFPAEANPISIKIDGTSISECLSVRSHVIERLKEANYAVINETGCINGNPSGTVVYLKK